MNSEKGRLEETTNKGGAAFINPRWPLIITMCIIIISIIIVICYYCYDYH